MFYKCVFVAFFPATLPIDLSFEMDTHAVLKDVDLSNFLIRIWHWLQSKRYTEPSQ